MSEVHEVLHTLHTDDGDIFDVAIDGAEFASTALIMVHGFGVDRTSRGLFTDITSAVEGQACAVRGDFSDLGDGFTKTVPFSRQVNRLRRVANFVQNDLDSERSALIGHSQGGLVIAGLHPRGVDALLLAPPFGEAFENFIKSPGWNRPGSYLDLEGESQLVRSDGSITIVPKEFWDEFKALGKVDPLIKELYSNNATKIYVAGEDNVLVDQEIPAGIDYDEIEGANHDFAGDARSLIVKKILEDLGL